MSSGAQSAVFSTAITALRVSVSDKVLTPLWEAASISGWERVSEGIAVPRPSLRVDVDVASSARVTSAEWVTEAPAHGLPRRKLIRDRIHAVVFLPLLLSSLLQHYAAV